MDRDGTGGSFTQKVSLEGTWKLRPEFLDVMAVCLLFSDDRTKTSDNYFTLLPGEEKMVQVFGCIEMPRLKILATIAK